MRFCNSLGRSPADVNRESDTGRAAARPYDLIFMFKRHRVRHAHEVLFRFYPRNQRLF
jgi:hypothetical protein